MSCEYRNYKANIISRKLFLHLQIELKLVPKWKFRYICNFNISYNTNETCFVLCKQLLLKKELLRIYSKAFKIKIIK